jgi:hypothetical protein
VPIIDIAWGEAKGQEFTLIVDNQVQLEAVEPAHGSLATGGAPGKDAVLVDAGIVTDGKRAGTILPAVQGALSVNGRVTGDIVMMNYYDPFQNFCPNTVSYAQTLNQHLATDVSGFGIIVDVFTAFGGPGVPNYTLCADTWMGPAPQQVPGIHPTNTGYQVIANTFATAILNN